MQDVVVGCGGVLAAAAAYQHYNSNNANSAIAGMWGEPQRSAPIGYSAQTMNSQAAPHTQLAPSGPQMQPGVPGSQMLPGPSCAQMLPGPVPQMMPVRPGITNQPPQVIIQTVPQSFSPDQLIIHKNSLQVKIQDSTQIQDFGNVSKLADEAQKVQKMIDLKQQRVAAENDDDEDQITVRQGK